MPLQVKEEGGGPPVVTLMSVQVAVICRYQQLLIEACVDESWQTFTLSESGTMSLSERGISRKTTKMVSVFGNAQLPWTFRDEKNARNNSLDFFRTCSSLLQALLKFRA